MIDISCKDLLTKYRSNHPEVFLGKGVLKICRKFTVEHPCRSAISIKLQTNFIEIAFRHGGSPANLLHIFRTPFPKKTSGLLLLKIITWLNYMVYEFIWSYDWQQKFHLACRESPTIALSRHVKLKENH